MRQNAQRSTESAMLDAGCNKIAYAHHKDDIIGNFRTFR